MELHTTARANDLYANANRRRYCPGAIDFVVTNLHRWHGTRQHPSQPFDGRHGPLAPYLGAEGQVRECPALTINLPARDPRRFEANCGGFGYNQAFLGRWMAKRESGSYRVETDALGAQADRLRRPAQTVMFTDTAFLDSELIEYSFAEPRFFPAFGSRATPSIHFRHSRRANVAWCDGHVDAHRRTFTQASPWFPGDPARAGLGWFGQRDDNSLFDPE